MKRVVALLLCLVLLLGQLAACNNSAGSILDQFDNWLENGDYSVSTTTNPDGTHTTTVTPPGSTTLPSTTTAPSVQPTTNTTKPTTTAATSAQPTPVPTTTPVTTTRPTTGTTAAPTATVTVPMVTTEPPVLKLKKTSLLLEAIGATYNLADGNIEPNKILWFSQNESIATVSNGIVTARAVGSTRIYANYKDQTVYCTVTVQTPTTDPPPVLELRYRSLTLLQGASQSIYNGTIPAVSIYWQTSNNRVASVSDGEIGRAHV